MDSSTRPWFTVEMMWLSPRPWCCCLGDGPFFWTWRLLLTVPPSRDQERFLSNLGKALFVTSVSKFCPSGPKLSGSTRNIFRKLTDHASCSLGNAGKKIKVKLQIVGAHLHLTKWNYTVVDGTHHFTMMQMHAIADIEFNIHAVKGNKHLEFSDFHPGKCSMWSKIRKKIFPNWFGSVFFCEFGRGWDFFGCALQSASFCAKKLIGCGTQRCCKLRFCLLIDACLELFKVIFHFVPW